jgi:hypothetical protein
VLLRWGLIPFWILLANSGGAAEVSEKPINEMVRRLIILRERVDRGGSF